MTNYVHGHIAGRDILKALGIPADHVRGITLRAFVNEAVKVEIERFVTDDELVIINQIIERERKNPTPPEHLPDPVSLRREV